MTEQAQIEDEDRRFGVRELRTCEYPGCERLNKGGYQALCERHYRERRVEKLPTLFHADKPERMGRYENRKTGYILLRDKTHSLSNKQGYVYEHRAVAFQKYGPGSQTCYWCNADIEWADLHVDHLDWNRTNNTFANLVTSCPDCNVNRNSPKAAEPVDRSQEDRTKLRNLIRRLND